MFTFAVRHRPAAALALTGAVLAYAWWVTTLRPFSWSTFVAVESAGVAAIAYGSRLRSPAPRDRPSRPGLVVWATLIGALGALELTAYVRQPRADNPTLSSLMDAALSSHPLRAAGFVVWLVVAVWIARR